MVILLGPSGHPAIPRPKDTKSIQNDFTQSIQKTKTLCHFRQNDFRMTSDPRLLFLPPALQRGRWAPTCRSCRWRCCRARRANSSNNGRDDPWWSMMIHDDPFPSVSSFCFQFLFHFCFHLSRLKLSTRRRDDKGCFPRYFGLVLSALSCLSPSKKTCAQAVYHKNVKRMQTMVHSTLIAKHLVVAPGAYILSENAKLHFQDQHRYLEISWNDGWTIVIFQILFTQSVYLYIICIYKCINILSIQSLMVFSCLFMSFHVSTERSRSPFAFSIWTFVFFARWPETRSNECADFLRAFWLFSQAWLLSTP